MLVCCVHSTNYVAIHPFSTTSSQQLNPSSPPFFPLPHDSAVCRRPDDRGSCALRPCVTFRYQMQQFHLTRTITSIRHGDLLDITDHLSPQLVHLSSHILSTTFTFNRPYSVKATPKGSPLDCCSWQTLEKQ